MNGGGNGSSGSTSLAQERILLIGDIDRSMHAALSQILPAAQLTPAPSYFDAIADLAGTSYTTVLAAAAPIGRRPEAAVKTLRELAGDSRLLLFGNPGYEPISRKMLDFGLADYIVTPTSLAALQQMFGTPPLRLAPSPPAEGEGAGEPQISVHPGRLSLLSGVPLAQVLLDAMIQQPNLAPKSAIHQLNQRIGPMMKLALVTQGQPAPSVPEGSTLLSHATRTAQNITGTLHLVIPRDEDETTARHLLAQLAHAVGGLMQLEERHRRLTKLAFTDDLTGLWNARYFKFLLEKHLKQASKEGERPYSMVTLLLFDIDNFKSYNDRFGHCVGDEILKQTAQVIRSSCREHDHVARISGDEFAVIFWEKEGPRLPRDAKATSPAPPGPRVPQTIVQILERFQHAIANSDLKMLGPHGRGVLSISGGLAVYPHDAATPQQLYDAADKALMFGAKKGGKNSIYLIGTPELTTST